ncbi:MAG: methylated-DNA--[protein]-cysteine S-methyltransferase [Cyanobacteria bacterium]|nr:methylated-DNA--[protein]-cysteine S-methyltransferase [Cyanobacteriota bacterium]MDW8202155.1 methylated-DNA--[protein]-cysteine S-methyltransferase [Cyanobacteriota bacterium SKYGB_h_bin112]
MTTYDRIYAVVCQIPYGRVATYGQVAELVNLPGCARLVGYALYRVNRQSVEIPWHRVINAKGTVSFSSLRQGSDYLQQRLLEAEGIQFDCNGRLSLRTYQWHPPLTSFSTNPNMV